MNIQTEALRLADQLVALHGYPLSIKAAAELRRLHKSELSGEKLRRRFVKATFAKKELLNALRIAIDHIDMAALEISHCKDAERIRSAITKAEAA